MSMEHRINTLMTSDKSRSEIINTGRKLVYYYKSNNVMLDNELSNLYLLQLISILLSCKSIIGYEKNSLFAILDYLNLLYPDVVTLIWADFYPVKNIKRLTGK